MADPNLVDEDPYIMDPKILGLRSGGACSNLLCS